jgi:hypothetical protein
MAESPVFLTAGQDACTGRREGGKESFALFPDNKECTVVLSDSLVRSLRGLVVRRIRQFRRNARILLQKYAARVN